MDGFVGSTHHEFDGLVKDLQMQYEDHFLMSERFARIFLDVVKSGGLSQILEIAFRGRSGYGGPWTAHDAMTTVLETRLLPYMDPSSGVTQEIDEERQKL